MRRARSGDFAAIVGQAHRLSASQRRILLEVHDHMTMASCRFDHMGCVADDDLPKTEAEVTDFIRRRTKVWRDSWVLGPLRCLLNEKQS